jgi:hypothetical protein
MKTIKQVKSLTEKDTTPLVYFDMPDPEQKIAENILEIIRGVKFEKDTNINGKYIHFLDLEKEKILSPDTSDFAQSAGVKTFARIAFQDKYSETPKGDEQTFDEFWDNENIANRNKTFYQTRHIFIEIFNISDLNDKIYPLCIFSTWFQTKHKKFADMCLGGVFYSPNRVMNNISVDVSKRLCDWDPIQDTYSWDIDIMKMMLGIVLSISGRMKKQNEKTWKKYKKLFDK